MIWGNHMISGGVMVPSKNAWKNSVVWGSAKTLGSDGDNIIWGTQGDGDNIIWGTSTGANIIWGTSAGANIIWGTAIEHNIIWGTGLRWRQHHLGHQRRRRQHHLGHRLRRRRL